jgi:tricorn protease
MSKQSGYYRFPTICGSHVVFVCEDDLWSVPVTGGVAIRLTSNLGEVSHPFLSPDGAQLAFIGREEGHPEVYVSKGDGGIAKRLTFLGANTTVVGWSSDGKSIIYASNAAQPFRRIYNLYQISPEGGLGELLPFGLASHVSYSANGGVIIGRNTSDIARWKRYRGGTTGVIWIDPTGAGNFHKLIDLPGNLASPMWVGERIYFICDHELIGNLYSCNPNGLDVKKHTDHQEYYVRNATTDGKRIVYHAGAELFYFDPVLDQNQAIAVEFHSPQIQRQRKFVDATNYLENYNLHPDGHSAVVTARGKSFWFGNWEGAVTQIGRPDGVRYRLTCWLNDGKRFVTISDHGGVEAIEIHSCEPNQQSERLEGLDLGRTVVMEVSPTTDMVALSNHRHELILVDLNTKQSRVLDRSAYHRIGGFCWAPDGKWLAYGFSESAKVSTIKICSVEDGSTYHLTEPRFWDYAPNFDPDGKFIYFLSYREFNPVYDSLYFDLGFPRGIRPFLISLQKDTRSPFIAVPKPLTDKPKQEKSNGKVAEGENAQDKEDKKTTELKIDFDGINNRVVGFPVPEGRYGQVIGLKGKVLLSSFPIKGSLKENDDWWNENDEKASLDILDFEQQKQETVATEVSSFKVAQDKETIIYYSKKRLRVCKAAPKSNGKNGKLEDEPGRKTGWLDLKRLQISVVPTQEWQQMFCEAWRLQKEHFWVEDMSGVDWEKVYQRYRPLLDKVSSRSEFSDLIWELQGELGTSHAYEMGGDYRPSPGYRLGFLGADFSYDPTSDAYRVEHIVKGDSWNEKADSPLNTLGANIQVGDLLVWVAGQRVGRQISPQELLVHKADSPVNLTFAGSNSEEYRTITVKTLRNESKLRYREWVERNRQIVREKTAERVGYVHIPDMGPNGYAEFHRYYKFEAQQEGLIVDVRYNGGGHVSQLLLEKLARQRIGYNISRWGQPQPYPADSIAGPMLAITNEYAGSDGDIFSHCFKLMKLGTLIGKRTWGGVIGISPRHGLVDGSVLTQPEFSFWFKDVGWKVENYGTDPDIEVEITPQDWVHGKDPQLDQGISLILQQLQNNPVLAPSFGSRPILKLPG